MRDTREDGTRGWLARRLAGWIEKANSGDHEVFDVLRDADLRADARHGGADVPRLPGAGGARRRARLPLRLGGRAPRPVRVLALVGAGGLPVVRRGAHASASASATASRCSPSATTTRSASPSASRRSTSCRAGGSTGARASRRRWSSRSRSRTTSRRCTTSGSRRSR